MRNVFFALLFLSASAGADPLPEHGLEVAPDGAWTWFNDERAIVHRGSLFSGYVRSDGRVGVTRFDLATGETHPMVLGTERSREEDDHNNPSLTPLPDGRLLALYSRHHTAEEFYQRVSKVPLPSRDEDWEEEFVHPVPARNTYNNTYPLGAERNRIYNFHRCINFNPTLTLSDDLGATWQPPRQFLGTGSGNVRPYPRYASNGRDRIDLIYTDGHPRDVDNSIYHLFYHRGALHRSDGSRIAALDDIPLDHDGGQRGGLVYEYKNAGWSAGSGPDDWIPRGRAWTWDIHPDPQGRPVCVFQVQKDDVTGEGWEHDRIYYYYARWTGKEWQRRFIAQAGRGIYRSEDDYGGGMCIDPENPRVIYISTNAARPFDLGDIDDVPLAENGRYEIWRGVTRDGGLSFTWSPVTENSAADNLRPIVPIGHGMTECVLWFNGRYTSYTDYETRVLGRIVE